MRAAVLEELGTLPEIRDLPDPVAGEREALVRVLAAPLNPIDIAVGAGRFYGGHPPLPYVPGAEAVGVEQPSGRLVWVFGNDFGVRTNGGIAELAAAPAETLVPVPDGAQPALAGALGVAGMAGWLPLTYRAPVRRGETVLVLGATGTVGLVAVQAARLLGAGRVVAAGRAAEGLARAEALGADAVVQLDGDDLAGRLREASGGEGPSLVVDPLWGGPARVALEAAAPGARIVNLGQSAGPEATLPSSLVRGKQLEILGYSNFAVPRDVVETEYARLVEHALAGRLSVDVEEVPLDVTAEAWRRQAEGAGKKIVVVP